MSHPNRNTLWAETFVDELAAGGVDAVCLAPGSRSTPLTVAFAAHDDVEVFSYLDERSAAFFALGRAKRTGTPTPVVCTSGTAAANFHPAVIEADRARVPMLVLTADRPPELRDSGANQTVDQEKLYGDAVRWYADLAEPEAEARKLRSLRAAAARAIDSAVGTPPGPVHLNFPFRKPLEPTEVPGDVPAAFAERHPLAVRGRDGPFVRVSRGVPELDASSLGRIADRIADAERGLLVVGPADAPTPDRDALATLADATGFPILADPLSGHRFGHDRPVVGGYDSYLVPDVTDDWPDPEVVLRFGASPTSKALRRYLERTDARQYLVDSAGGWREASFTATDLVVADPTRFAEELAGRFADSSATAGEEWRRRFDRAEMRHWNAVADTDEHFEGGVLASVSELVPDPTTLFVSNSMPVRDLDRFGEPRPADLTVLGNRGASGIDGIVSTALGAGSATDDPLVLVTGDLAYYHDMNGLLALGRCGVDATVVEINNDGGGIFHMLPIESFDPPFTGQFRTPHGLDFEPTGDLYGFDFERVDALSAFRERFRASLDAPGTQVVEVVTDAEASHRTRESVRERVVRALSS
ncbi:2-succinyl-5-enolpyruvyl-6-hydroxy-3-cyclohexene-1-carboxylic-acid synthase [Haladaptatus salinisoli]|uniref:2-succinyl-5-enolpyruvyl-6-hydroxy-3- cyclohexene-1-carboxylic-acid synthase n=1 Tax=Haladaptatus salinisoli TaxID=2884876 RepID=UPI001D0A0780|nr:2-succinyl-5-enolpyruvyl-6-hydroxy-3-cyclohexene-1-carboxylic-acid synthase [Haladaptatus salinisoli]